MSFKINPDLLKIIKEQHAKNPKKDGQALVNLIVQGKLSRLSKHAIKSGVEEYFKIINKCTEQAKISSEPKNNNINVGNDQADDIKDFQSIRKKVKTNQNNKLQIQFGFKDSPDYNFQKLGGVSKILQQIKDNILTPIKQRKLFSCISSKNNIFRNRGIIINGTIGSGKSTLGNCILSSMKVLGYQGYMANLGSFLSLSNDAQQKMKKLFQIAEQNQPSVIFFDDLQIICQKDSRTSSSGKSGISPMLFTFMSCVSSASQQGKQVYLIATTSSLQKIDEKLRRLNFFEKVINIDAFLQQERIQVFTKIIQNNDIKNDILQDQKSAEQIKQITNGYVISDIFSLIKEAHIQCVLRNKRVIDIQKELKIQIQDIRNAAKNIQPILKKQGFTNIPTTTLDDVGALQQLKAELKKQIIIPLKQKQKFKAMNFQMNGAGVLLYGPPGCGKTMLAKAIANQAKANFIIVKGPQLLTKYVGESQEAVRKVFQRARNSSPCIIFFDQFDALAPKRQDQGNQVTERVVNTLLNELNGVDDRKMVFVIAATNRPDIIDEAVLRSGRIQKHLFVPMPNESEREEILKTICSKMNKEEGIQFHEIAKKCHNFSGADLRYIVKEATVKAIMQGKQVITQNAIQKAIQIFLQNKNKRSKYKFGASSISLPEKEIEDNKFEQQQENQKYKFSFGQKTISRQQSNNYAVQQQEQRKPSTNKLEINQKLINQFLNFMLLRSGNK